MNKKLNGTRKSVALFAAVLAMMGMAGTQSAQACGAEPYLGMICMTAASYCPRGYIEARGQMLPISEHQALFALLGTSYGGDGRSTFGMPDMRGRTPMGLGRAPGSAWDIRQGQIRGREMASLSIANMPAHSHGAQFTSSGATGTVTVQHQVSKDAGLRQQASDGDYLSQSNAGRAAASSIFTDTATNGTAYLSGVSGSITDLNVAGAVAVGSSGNNQPFELIPPQIGVRYCVASDGVFPPRD